MDLYLQVLINGILLGGLYGIVALGFSLVWGVMGIINVAHGSLLMIGAYVTFWLFNLLGVDPFLSIPVAMAVLFVVGYLLQRFFINFVLPGGLLMTLIITFGLDLMLVNVATLLWSANQRAAAPPYSGTILALGDLLVPYVRLIIFGVAVLLVVLVYLFLTYSKTGRAIRAVALNKEAAQLTGVNLRHTYNLTFAIGAAIAGAAGSLVATTFVVTPEIGGGYLLKAFIVTVLGGMGNLAGALIGGLVLGLAETFGAVAFGTGYQDAIGVIIFVVALAIRPQGLVGKRFFGED